MTGALQFVGCDKFAQANAGISCPLGSGKEIRDQVGERPGVNRPVERHTGRLTPTARHELVGRLLVRWGLRTVREFRGIQSQPAGMVGRRGLAGENPASVPCCGRS